jgi:hypothetical protein
LEDSLREAKTCEVAGAVESCCIDRDGAMLRGKEEFLGGGKGEMDRAASEGGAGETEPAANVERTGDEIAEFEPAVRAA